MLKEIVLVIKYTLLQASVWDTTEKSGSLCTKISMNFCWEQKCYLFVVKSKDIWLQLISKSCEALTVKGIFDVRHPTGLCSASLLS